MNAALQNTGRSAVKERVEEMGNGSRRPVAEKITVKLHYGDESTDERRTKHAQATGTSRGLWK